MARCRTSEEGHSRTCPACPPGHRDTSPGGSCGHSRGGNRQKMLACEESACRGSACGSRCSAAWALLRWRRTNGSCPGALRLPRRFKQAPRIYRDPAVTPGAGELVEPPGRTRPCAAQACRVGETFAQLPLDVLVGPACSLVRERYPNSPARGFSTGAVHSPRGGPAALAPLGLVRGSGARARGRCRATGRRGPATPGLVRARRSHRAGGPLPSGAPAPRGAGCGARRS